MHKEDDCHFGAWNTCVEGEVDWTPFHSTEGVWSWPVPHDPTHPEDQTQAGHPSIPPRVFGPGQYLMTPPILKTKPKLTSKLLPALSSILKLVLQET